MKAGVPGLAALARLHGIQASYRDAMRRRQTAPPESILAVLRALGAPVEGPRDIPAAIQSAEYGELAALEPVVVAWDGRCPDIPVRLGGIEATIEPEDEMTPPLGASQVAWKQRDAETSVLRLRGRLPAGYHRLRIAGKGCNAESLIISAPVRAFTGTDGNPRRWGVFLPLYSLRRSGDWGAGDYTGLGKLVNWSSRLGAQVVSTLPLFASYLDGPFEPSPYSPVSRLFWNDFYVDPTAAPEFRTCAPAQELVSCREFQHYLDGLRSVDRVRYRRVYGIRRRAVELLAREVFDKPGERLDQLMRFTADRPGLEEYSRFRATTEGRGQTWRSWPEAASGRLPGRGHVEASYRYHLYAQFLAAEQLDSVSQSARAAGAQLMLDLPLGVNPAGYDTWRERESFAEGLSAGAPPDSFFTLGQDWGFSPPHPAGARRTGYRYYRASLRNLMQYAGTVRIDHVAGLHRMFCIPQGMTPEDGMYVRYRPDELYAILSLESHRHAARIVGEDLGTVPRYVRRTMAKHAVYNTYVLQYEATPEKAPAPPSTLSAASLNTHDMPPFAAFWQGLDIADREDLGLLGAEEAKAERGDREAVRRRIVATLPRRTTRHDEPSNIAGGLLARMAAGNPNLLLVNLEDLWGETRPQNVPGTTIQRPNWRRKSGRSLEDLEQSPAITRILAAIDHARKAEVRK
jgi:4-alpha-glucanotransferase